MMKNSRFLLAAGASGSGKTLITCGILQAFVTRGMKVSSFKCGPDYIDPMFHTKVIGTKSRNLDTFFTDDNTTNYLLKRHGEDTDISVIEGVMGYYDGLGGTSEKASTYELAKVTKTPVVLIVNCRGMSLSIIPYIKGFLSYREDSQIKGVILNQISPVMYQALKEKIEEELPIRIYGYLKKSQDYVIESRHLGLLLPEEMTGLKERLKLLAQEVEKSIDLDGLLELGETSSSINCISPQIPGVGSGLNIAVANDEAFNFLYEEHLDLLREMGASLTKFSPLHDERLPKGVHGLLLPGGYPELYAKALSENDCMKDSIREALDMGLPCLAECGGFMYLHKEMEDMEGRFYPMVGSVKGRIFRTHKLGRFGYIQLTSNQTGILGLSELEVKGHEYHYFDSTCCGNGFTARKPVGKRFWEAGIANENCILGFPHLSFYSNLELPKAFLKRCRVFMEKYC
jgi:cobyrinic acid a,c-diamide synthase